MRSTAAECTSRRQIGSPLCPAAVSSGCRRSTTGFRGSASDSGAVCSSLIAIGYGESEEEFVGIDRKLVFWQRAPDPIGPTRCRFRLLDQIEDELRIHGLPVGVEDDHDSRLQA